MYMATITQAVTIGALIGKSQLFIKKKTERNREKSLKNYDTTCNSHGRLSQRLSEC